LSTYNKGAGVFVDSGASGAPAPPAPHAPTHAPQTGSDPLATGPAGTINIGDAAATGTADTLARSDHVHAVVAPGNPEPNYIGNGTDPGVSPTPARSDHLHAFPSPTVVATQVFGAGTTGASLSAAREDHEHPMAAPALPAAQVIGAGSAGAAATPARADHVHPMAAVAPAAHAATHAPQLGTDPLATAAPGGILIGDAAATGTANSLARSDHVHELLAPPNAMDADPLVPSGPGVDSRVARWDHLHRVIPEPVCTFRLSPSSTEPVPTADVIGGSLIYWHPYGGNRMTMVDILGGLSAFLISPAPISFDMAASPRTAGRPFDLFIRNLAGVPTLTARDWASATTRAVALALNSGFLVDGVNTVHRYLGTVYARTATTFDWTIGGLDSAAHLDIWNYYNRVTVGWRCNRGLATWTQPVNGVWRGASGVDTMRCEWVCGVQEDKFCARLLVGSDNTASSRAAAIGLDSTTAVAAACNYQHAASSPLEASAASLDLLSPLGFHFAEWIERSQAATPTWYGTLADNYRYGLQGEWRA
jgi:hypothetical protein